MCVFVFVFSQFSSVAQSCLRNGILVTSRVVLGVSGPLSSCGILNWFAIPFSSGPRFVRTLHHDPSILDGPTQHGFIELDKAGLVVIRLVSFL